MTAYESLTSDHPTTLVNRILRVKSEHDLNLNTDLHNH